jgi:hypothetical protein
MCGVAIFYLLFYIELTKSAANLHCNAYIQSGRKNTRRA